MKLAVLSDIHGNVAALEAVLDDLLKWQPDRVVVNGDLLNRGPESLQGWDLLMDALPNATLLRGNHETFLLHCRDNSLADNSNKAKLRSFVDWTLGKIGERVDELESWADNLDLKDPDGGEVHITHGSRRGNRDGIHQQRRDDLLEQIGDPTQLFISSHTHKPFADYLHQQWVVNTGSVGSPFDLDPRSSYGRFQFRGGVWYCTIQRVAYDRQRTESAYQNSGFLDEGGPFAKVMLRELQLSRGLMGPWMHQYHDTVLSGKIEIETAVSRFLAEY